MVAETLLEQIDIDFKEILEVEPGDIVETLEVNMNDERAIIQYSVDEKGKKHLLRGNNVLRYLENKEIPSPEVLKTNFEADYPWHLLEKVDGRHPEMSTELFLAGQSLAKIHLETEGDFESPGFTVITPEADSLIETYEPWSRMASDLFHRYTQGLEGTEFEPANMSDVIDYWNANLIPDDVEISLLHGDVSPSNVLITDQPVWIDYDQAIWGDPDYGAFCADQSLKVRDIDSEDFMRGYLSERQIEQDEKNNHYMILSAVEKLHKLKEQDRKGIYRAPESELERLENDLEKAIRNSSYQ